jgi:Protein of unknown function DUF262/Protein of unknown function (DUF1524)
MPIREELTASPATLADILSNGKRYAVPTFQRDYAWDETEWSELWADIRELGTSTGEAGNHYLGALVLQPARDRGLMNIIDGQQRLVTLSLLALAIILRVERLAKSGAADAQDNVERARLLRERFVSTKDSASLQHRSRLELNATDNAFYQTYLVQGVSPPRPAALKGSERRLHRAFVFFDEAVGKHLGENAGGAELARFLEEVIAPRLRFISITVQDDETAFAVFETLNARGVALGTADLLKNFVFAMAAKGGSSDLDQARLLWEQILRLVPMPQVASLLFHKLAATVPELREKRVFAEVKRLVPQERSVFDFLRELRAAADIYSALDDPNDEFWVDFPEARKSVSVLDIVGAHQYRPVILAAYQQFADRPEKLSRLLRNLVMISVRATVVRVNTGDVQRANQSTAIRVANGELESPHAIARALGDITPSDDEFRAQFAVLSIDPKSSRKRWLRYLLGELEAAAGGKTINFELGDVTMEHILPANPSSNWETFSPEDRLRDTTRLGNLTPLEHSLNVGLGAADYDRKRAVYQKSGYALTRAIVAEEWTPATLRSRQETLADLAIKVWRVEAREPKSNE